MQLSTSVAQATGYVSFQYIGEPEDELAICIELHIEDSRIPT
jgi:hypothetical protein